MIPRTPCRARAATPRASKASAAINLGGPSCGGTPLKPAPPPAGLTWPTAPDPARARRPAPGGRRARPLSTRTGYTAGLTMAMVINWLAGLPGRLGDQLFTRNDTEASWRGWRTTKVDAGFGRRYRDPRFDALAGT